MKRVLLLLICCYISSGAAYSQTFLHGAGVGINHAIIHRNDFPQSFIAVHYSPQFTFVENNNSSFSVGIPLTAGIGGDLIFGSDLFYDTDEMLTIVQAPLMVSFNHGVGAHKQALSRTGFFLGGGVAYHVTGVDIESEYLYGSSVYSIRKSYARGFAPAFHAGVRFALGKKGKKNIEMKASYMQGLNGYKPAVLGTYAVFNF